MHSPSATAPSERIQSLEGLRGIAAFIVILSHLALMFWPALHLGPKAPMVQSWQLWIFNSPLPFIYSGTYSVYVFFALSGYVLSLKFVKTGDERAIRFLFAQRYFRLAIPITAAVLSTWALHHLGAFDASRDSLPPFMKEVYRSNMTFWGAVREGVFGAIFQGHSSYDFVIWTMQIEFFGSLLIFSNCLLLHQITE